MAKRWPSSRRITIGQYGHQVSSCCRQRRHVGDLGVEEACHYYTSGDRLSEALKKNHEKLHSMIVSHREHLVPAFGAPSTEKRMLAIEKAWSTWAEAAEYWLVCIGVHVFQD